MVAALVADRESLIADPTVETFRWDSVSDPMPHESDTEPA
jgi:hypothetical protein